MLSQGKTASELRRFPLPFILMQSSDTSAPVGERLGAPVPSAAAAKARQQNNGVDDKDEDHIIDAALSGRFVLSADEVNLFFFEKF